MYCKAGVACTNPEVYGDIKRGRRLAPSKGIVCPRCSGKCCNEACLEKHKCKQRARPSGSAGALRAGAQGNRWQGLDPSAFDPTGLLDPNMALALARAGQGALLLPQGGNMMQIPLALPFPFMLNAAALQQAGLDGALDPAQLQAALAAAGAMGVAGGAAAAGGLSAPMMLAPLANPGMPNGDAAAVSQALQLAQLQSLQAAAGLGAGQLLQLTVQPDGSTGVVPAGNGQRLGVPPGLMQGLPGLQLPGGLQLLSPEQLQLAAAAESAAGNLPLMQVMADGTAGMDQATLDAVAAAAAAGGLPGNLMAGLTALTGMSSSDAQAFLEQQQQLNLQNATAAAVAAAAAARGEGLPGTGADAGEAGLPPGALSAEAAAAALAEVNAAALAAAAGAGDAAAQQASEGGGAPPAGAVPDAAAPPADNAAAVSAGGAAVLPGAAALDGTVLPAIPPLHMAPAVAAALSAASGGRGLYHAEEDNAAVAALMSLATDKKETAAAAAAAAKAAMAAAEAGMIPQARAAEALQSAQQLADEAQAEAAQLAAQQLQDTQAQPDSLAGVGEDVKAEIANMSEEQLQQLLLQQVQLQHLLTQQQQQDQQDAQAAHEVPELAAVKQEQQATAERQAEQQAN